MKILITGGTGMVGSYLCKKLKEKGHEVAILSRKGNKEGEITSYTWNLEKNEIDGEAIDWADGIIHLAGANIGEKRWSESRKKLIIDSRVKTGELIFNKLKEQNKKLECFISASAIGYYGAISVDKIFTETDPPGNDFLGETCRKWEEMADKFIDLGIRTVKLRTGVVLSQKGGALARMMNPVKLGFGSALGSGKQYLPWIHIDDLCNIYIKAIEDNQMNGAYNAVAPDHKTNKEFTRILASILQKPFWFPNIPAFILRIIFGKMAKLFLEGSKVSSDKILEAGYQFNFPNLETALNQLLQGSKTKIS